MIPDDTPINTPVRVTLPQGSVTKDGALGQYHLCLGTVERKVHGSKLFYVRLPGFGPNHTVLFSARHLEIEDVQESALGTESKILGSEASVAEFYKVVEPVMKWLAGNHHIHTQVTINSSTAQLWEGLCSHNTEKFLKD